MVAPRHGIAVLGAILTHPRARRRGNARAITGALVTDLLYLGCQDVALNVAVDNDAAIRVYRSLGFQTHCEFWTGACVSTRRNRADVPGLLPFALPVLGFRGWSSGLNL